ncbi:FGGY family carbohydrate kinase [Sphingomonas glacialis]|nr:FGGY family carbohydrate kinase [Sphingomonas glacialis]
MAILALDQGTSNSKALLVAPDGTVLASRARSMRVDHPKPGWAEQSALDIRDTIVGLIDEVVAAAPDVSVAAVAIANQRETVVLWDADTGLPLGPAVIWQCGRSAERCAALREAGHADDIFARSGLALDPMFSAGKLAWLLNSVPGARDRAAAGTLRAGTIDSWLVWQLTAGAIHATEPGNAARTQLFNLDTLSWDAELARLFDVPLAILPKIQPSDSHFGSVAPGLTALPDATPIHAVLGDSHAALFEHIAASGAQVKATMGTGSSVMAATDRRIHSTHGLSSTIGWSRGDIAQHAIEGNIMVSGQAAAFATELLGLTDETALTDLAATVDDSAGVVFVPALAGLGAPHWCSDARGTISGLTLATRPAHVARATFEAIALQIGDVLVAIEADLGRPFGEMSVDGGAARNDLLAQLLADLLDRRIVRPRVAEASALGAARLAAEALGLTRTDTAPAPADSFHPSLSAARRKAIHHHWQSAITRALRPEPVPSAPE